MIGDILGPYRIDRELGSGGMGKVYAAVVDGRVPGLDKGMRVALKIVHPHLLEVPGFFKRFMREAELGRTVRHPNVVRTFDCDATGEQHFMAMEYVEGQTLRELLDELERVPEELCRHIGREVANGLAAIHDAGVIHRDMKPENVLITADHVVKVMDLGVARLVDEAQRLSQTGAFVGSLCYAAPESFQKGGADVDGRVDLHALGLVLYELACGSNPYEADGVARTIEKVVREPPRRLGDVNPQISPFFEEAVHCLLEKDREKRFATAGDLAAALTDGEDSEWWHWRASAIRSITKRPLRRVRIPRETAVYGREEELARLRGHYDAARSGEGTDVLIEGEAGIGKSRLVDELIARLQRDGEDVNFLFGSYPPGGAATAAGGFSTAYREQFGDAGCAAYLTTTPVLVPAFDALLRGEPTPAGSEPLTKESLQTCFVNATRVLGAERTTVVLIDDLHFAPDEGRALFTSLAMAVPGSRVLLIGTTRRGVAEDWLSGATRLDQTTHMSLHRLGPKDLMALLRDTLKSEELAHVLAGQIATKSDGNPFFVFEILQGLREGQFITRTADGSWVSTKVIDDIQIPSSVLDLVNARVADLSEGERDLLDVASCWGYEFDPALIGDVCGLDRIPCLKRFGHIERSNRLVRSVGRNYVFDHHQVQEALYQGLNEQLREEYHAALAEAMDTRASAADTDPDSLDGALCVDLCEHYLQGARGDQALRYLAAAQAHLTKGYLHARAVALTERALAMPGLLTGAARARVLLRLWDALDPIGDPARQEEVAREAEQLAEDAGDDALLCLALKGLGGVFYRTSRLDEAEAAVRRALEIAQRSSDVRAESGVTGNLGLILGQRGRLDDAREHHARAVALSRQSGDRHGEANSEGNLGSVLHDQGHVGEARVHYERALEISTEIGDRKVEAICVGNLGTFFISTGRLREAREYIERQRALNREIGNRRGEGLATANLGVVLQSMGRVAAAREHYERNLELSRDMGGREGAAIALHNMGNAYREEGALARAEECLSACLAACGVIDAPHLAAATHFSLGSLFADAGDEGRARDSLVAARDGAATIGVVGLQTLARCQLACLPGGDANDALAAFVEIEPRLEASQRRNARWLLWKATGDRAHLAEAKRLLDEELAHVDGETRAAMLANLSRNCEITAACQEHGLA